MLKLWEVSFTYGEHEMETDVFVHTDSPRPSTEDARRMLLSQHTDDTDSGYMQDVIADPSLLVVDGVRLFETAGDLDGNPYMIKVMDDEETVTVDPAKVAARMLELRSKNQHDGYTNCLVDVLTEMYDIEALVSEEIEKQGGIDVDEFVDEVPHVIPGLSCSFDFGVDDLCSGDITSEHHQGKNGGYLCDKHWSEL